MRLSPSHTASRDMPTMHNPPLARSQRSFADTLIVVSSSGESSTLAELCMCTDYSSSPTAIPLLDGTIVVISGVSYSSASGALLCLRCRLRRPYRFMSLSTV